MKSMFLIRVTAAFRMATLDPCTIPLLYLKRHYQVRRLIIRISTLFMTLGPVGMEAIKDLIQYQIDIFIDLIVQIVI